MTLTNVIELLVSIIGLVAFCIWYAGRIMAQPPATAAERDAWPGEERHE